MGETVPAAKRVRTEDGGTVTGTEGISRPVPARPVAFLKREEGKDVGENAFAAGMEEVVAVLSSEMAMKDSLHKPCREMRSKVEACLRKVHAGTEVDVMVACSRELDALLELLKDCPEGLRLMGSVSGCIEAFVAADCLEGFLQTGTLQMKDRYPKLTTNEYLQGILRFADELEDYAIGRAMWLDTKSVKICRDMINEMFEMFLKFNFRNGTLRRKYDSLKYRVRKLENILYELSIANDGSNEETHESTSGTKRKSSSVEDSRNDLDGQLTPSRPNLLDHESFERMVEEIDLHTEARDEVIKAAREPQKNSKKAIFSLHRMEFEEARKLLASCVANFKKTVEETTLSQDELHGGAFGSALEEFAEARIFEEWLLKGRLFSFQEMKKEVYILPKDYLGGVVDFTGEIGRLAVQQATKRDIEAVKKVLATMIVIREYAVVLQELVTGKISKKLHAVITNEKKTQNTLYEMILVTRTKRKTLELTSPAKYDDDNHSMDTNDN